MKVWGSARGMSVLTASDGKISDIRSMDAPREFMSNQLRSSERLEYMR
jgi:hypothetical protein